MNRIELNLARRPFTNDLLPWVVVGVLVASALGLSIWNIGLFVSVRSQIAELQEQRSELMARQRDAERETAALVKSGRETIRDLGASRATFANQIIQQWAFRWTSLFNELERVIPYGVRLRTIRPRFEDGVRIRLGGVAKDNESFWNFQLGLLDAPAFGDVYPEAVQASDVRLSVGRGEQLFSLEMQYFPGGAGLGEPSPEFLQGAAGVAESAPEPAAEQASDMEAAVDSDDGPPPEEPAAVSPAVDGVKRPKAGVTRANRRGNKRRKAQPPKSTAGVSRGGNALPSSSPLVSAPQVRDRRPEVPIAGLDLSGYTRREDGVLVDENGNEVDIQDILQKNEREIRLLKPGETPPLSGDEDEGADDGGGQDVSGGVAGSKGDTNDRRRDR